MKSSSLLQPATAGSRRPPRRPRRSAAATVAQTLRRRGGVDNFADDFAGAGFVGGGDENFRLMAGILEVDRNLVFLQGGGEELRDLVLIAGPDFGGGVGFRNGQQRRLPARHCLLRGEFQILRLFVEELFEDSLRGWQVRRKHGYLEPEARLPID